MNERIRELIVESGNGQMRDGRLYPHIGIRFEEDWQRFAELLIQECVEQCNINFVGTVGTHPSAHNRGVQKCIDNIKQHFGVEE